jgi:hypothetical protein
MRKPTLILLIHLGEIPHIIQEHTAPHHLLQTGPGFLENGLEIENALFGLLGDGACVEGAGCVGGDLAGDEDEAGRGDADGLGVGSCC